MPGLKPGKPSDPYTALAQAKNMCAYSCKGFEPEGLEEEEEEEEEKKRRREEEKKRRREEEAEEEEEEQYYD